MDNSLLYACLTNHGMLSGIIFYHNHCHCVTFGYRLQIIAILSRLCKSLRSPIIHNSSNLIYQFRLVGRSYLNNFESKSNIWRVSDEGTNDYSLEVDKAMIMLKLMKVLGSCAAARAIIDGQFLPTMHLELKNNYWRKTFWIGPFDLNDFHPLQCIETISKLCLKISQKPPQMLFQ